MLADLFYTDVRTHYTLFKQPESCQLFVPDSPAR